MSLTSVGKFWFIFAAYYFERFPWIVVGHRFLWTVILLACDVHKIDHFAQSLIVSMYTCLFHSTRISGWARIREHERVLVFASHGKRRRMMEHEVYTAIHAARLITGFLYNLMHSADFIVQLDSSQFLFLIPKSSTAYVQTFINWLVSAKFTAKVTYQFKMV